MFRLLPPTPLLSQQEVDGMIVLLMSIDDGIQRIVRAVEDENGEEEDEKGS